MSGGRARIHPARRAAPAPRGLRQYHAGEPVPKDAGDEFERLWEVPHLRDAVTARRVLDRQVVYPLAGERIADLEYPPEAIQQIVAALERHAARSASLAVMLRPGSTRRTLVVLNGCEHAISPECRNGRPAAPRGPHPPGHGADGAIDRVPSRDERGPCNLWAILRRRRNGPRSGLVDHGAPPAHGPIRRQQRDPNLAKLPPSPCRAPRTERLLRSARASARRHRRCASSLGEIALNDTVRAQLAIAFGPSHFVGSLEASNEPCTKSS